VRAARRSGAPVAVVAGLVALVVIVLAGAAALIAAATGDDDGPLGGSSADPLPQRWSVDPYDISSDYGTFAAVDGTVTGWLLPTESGWVTMTEPSTPAARLVSLDPVDGAVQWSLDLPESRCTQLETNLDELVCLTRPSGGGFQLVRVGAGDGAFVGDPVAVDLGHVPYLLTPLGDGLLVLTADRVLSGVGLDGAVRWSAPIPIDSDADLTYLEIDVAHYPDATLLQLGWSNGTVHVTTAGEVRVLSCRAVAATPDAWVCEGDDETTGFAPDGTEQWAGPWDDYYLVDRYQKITPVVLVDNWDGSVSAIDATTGGRGDPVPVTDSSEHFSFLGDADQPAVTAEDSVTMLDPTGANVLWQTHVDDEYLNIAEGAVLDGTLVMSGERTYGFDLVTGEQLWSSDFLTTTLSVHDGALVGTGYGEVTRYEMP